MCERGNVILTSKIKIFFSLLLFIFKISILMSCVVGSLNDDRSAISYGWDIISSFVYQLSRKSNPVLGIS